MKTTKPLFMSCMKYYMSCQHIPLYPKTCFCVPCLFYIHFLLFYDVVFTCTGRGVTTLVLANLDPHK